MKRITIMLGVMAALMLVPAASALASPSVVVNVEGAGSGEVVNGGESEEVGTPPIECSYDGASVSGTCADAPAEPGVPGYYFSDLIAHSASGSEFGGWKVTKGTYFELFEELFGPGSGEFGTLSCPGNSLTSTHSTGPNPPEECVWETTEPGTEPGQEEFEVTATFCAEGTAKEEEVYNPAAEANETKLVGCEEGTGPEGPPLTTTIESGEGTVVSNPAGIECTGAAPHSCTTEEVEEGTVTLTASPAAGYAFKSWKGCDKKAGIYGVNGRQCTIDLTGERTVSAKFVKVYDLTLENGGSGKVSSKPGGALCLPNCSETTASFEEGKTVEVLAKANKHFHLASWGGDCSGTGSCSVSMGADHTVSATFAEDAKFTLALAKQGGGSALIKTKGPGTVCSYTCSQSSASFYTGEEVLVSWKLNKGTSSLTWSTGAGTCTGTHEGAEGSCTVTMSAAKSLVAELE